jgi:hypothetical protein
MRVQLLKLELSITKTSGKEKLKLSRKLIYQIIFAFPLHAAAPRVYFLKKPPSAPDMYKS